MDIRLENIVKKYGNKTVLDGFSHTFKDGRITAVCGESGCGKTTLIRIIAGLDEGFTGTVSPTEFTVSVAFQEHRLFPGATVSQNVELADDSGSGLELLLLLGIGEESFSTLPHQLSGGMARRVSLARAIVKSADVYLFDEPFSGLDDENAENTAAVLKKYCEGKTCIVVTHNRQLAERFADDFLFLD